MAENTEISCKRCPKCATSKPLSEFCNSTTSKDGKAGYCKDCGRDYMRGRKSDPVKRRENAYRSTAKNPVKRQAREKVKDAVRAGRLPTVKSCRCHDCNEPATAYDHYNGYDYPLDVQPVCHECHGKRSRARGEHKKEAGRELNGRTYDDTPLTIKAQ